MNQEKVVDTGEYSEMGELIGLYEEAHRLGGVVRETSQGNGFLTCVGDEEYFRKALELGPEDAITQEALDGLPLMLLFAYPGAGATRVEALTTAFEGWRASRESTESGRQFYNSFEIAGGTMSAYLPVDDEQKRQWTIEYTRDGEVVFTDYAEMVHDSVFGVDIEDRAVLNQRVEELVAEHKLES